VHVIVGVSPEWEGKELSWLSETAAFAVQVADVSGKVECEWGLYEVEEPVRTSLTEWPASVNSDDEVEEVEEEVEDIVIEGIMRFRILAE